MKRTVAVVGLAVVAVLGTAAVQAQGRQGRPSAVEQRGGRPGMGPGMGLGRNGDECGPFRLQDGPGQGMGPGRGMRPGGPQGGMRGRGQGLGPQGAAGRPGGQGRPAGPGRMGGRGRALCGLDLTADQRTQIKALRNENRKELEAILTPEQLAKLRARRGGGLEQK